MDKEKIHYCFTLSEEQLEYLRSKKYKIDRMECFMSLVVLAEQETKLVSLSKPQQVEILPGQVMVDNTQLAKLWDKDRKTVPKLLVVMESLGISSSQKIGENRIHTLHSLSGWYMDGRFVKNPFALRRDANGSAIVRVDVPPARVITTDVADGIIKGKDGSGLDGYNSQEGNMGKISSVDGHVSYPSPQSNDSGNVSKFRTGENSSLVPKNDNSAHSDGILSSKEEAYGIRNGGKRNE